MKESKTRERSSHIHTVSLEVKIEKKEALKA